MSNEGIANELNTSSPTVQRALKALLDSGFVVREPSAQHRTGRILRSNLPVDNSSQPHQIDEPPHQIDEPTSSNRGTNLIKLMNQPHQIDEQHINLHIQSTYKLEREGASAPLPPVDNFSLSDSDLKNQGSNVEGSTEKTKLTEQLLEHHFGHDKEICDGLKSWLQTNRQLRRDLPLEYVLKRRDELGTRWHAVVAGAALGGWRYLNDQDSIGKPQPDQLNAQNVPQNTPTLPTTEGGRAYEALRVALAARDQLGLKQAGLDYPPIRPTLEKMGGQQFVLQRISALTGAGAHSTKQEFISTYTQLQKEL